MTHAPIACKRDTRGTQYVGKGYRSEFVCPACARSCWQHMSFLGRRDVVCNGSKFTKEPKAKVSASPEYRVPLSTQIDPQTAVKVLTRMRTVLAEIEEYVNNYVDIDWEGRPNWAMDIKVMLEKAPGVKF